MMGGPEPGKKSAELRAPQRLSIAVMMLLGLLPATLSILLLIVANAFYHQGLHRHMDTPMAVTALSMLLLARTRLRKVSIAILAVILGAVAAWLSGLAVLIIASLLDLKTLFGDRGYW